MWKTAHLPTHGESADSLHEGVLAMGGRRGVCVVIYIFRKESDTFAEIGTLEPGVQLCASLRLQLYTSMLILSLRYKLRVFILY